MKENMQQWAQIMVVCLAFVLGAEAYYVDITYLESAVAKGAVCMDGSPPAYHFDKGFGAGVNNWLVHFEGGGWCDSVEACLAKRDTRLGSSKQMTKQMTFSGIFSREAKYNPDFYNWNRVRVRYCDGSSFTGDVEAVDPSNKLYFRGMRIYTAVMDELLQLGMSNAQNALLSGCSAGGLTSILHCDKFNSLFPPSTKVKCLADAGFFINTQAVSGESIIENFYAGVVATHGSAKNLPSSCTSRMNPSLCLFPENAASGVQTPLFLVNAAYDSWQIKNILAPGLADPHGTWHNCKADITKCSTTQLATMQDFRLNFLKALSGIGSSKNFYINSCYAHCQTGTQETWLRNDSPILGGKTISGAVGDWYFDRSSFQKIDCPYPCDKTCHNRIFENDGHSE